MAHSSESVLGDYSRQFEVSATALQEYRRWQPLGRLWPIASCLPGITWRCCRSWASSIDRGHLSSSLQYLSSSSCPHMFIWLDRLHHSNNLYVFSAASAWADVSLLYHRDWGRLSALYCLHAAEKASLTHFETPWQYIAHWQLGYAGHNMLR